MNVTNAVVPSCCPSVLVTVTVVLLVMAVPVLLDTAFAKLYCAVKVTSFLMMKSSPEVMERLPPAELVMVVSVDVLKVVETVTPWEMAKEQGPPVQTLGFATRDCLPASGTGSLRVMVQLVVSKASLMSRFGVEGMLGSLVAWSSRNLVWRWWIRLGCGSVSIY